MSAINLNQLFDKALDVDPDISFMALEDFKKYLILSPSVSVKGVERFIPILFHLIEQNNSDLQSQAVKTFSPLMVYLSASLIIEVVNKLFEMVEVENKKELKKITISIPNMALRAIFSSNYKFSHHLSRSIISSLVPRILSSSETITIDLIEILTYLVKYIGSSLTRDELESISQMLIRIIYKENGVVGKRSVYVLDLLLGYLNDNDNDLINSLVELVTSQNQLQGSSTSLSLYSVILKNSIPRDLLSDAPELFLLSGESIDLIFNQITQSLQLQDIEEQLDPNDFDYDHIVQQCSVREDGLTALSAFINVLPFECFEPYSEAVVGYIKLFLKYDPLNFCEDSIYDEEEEDDLDIEFSDDEAIDGFNDESDNDCSWKLRKQSSLLIRDLSQHFQQYLLEKIFVNFVNTEYLIKSLNDRNNVVSDEVIGTLNYIFNAIHQRRVNQKPSISHNRKHSDVSMIIHGDLEDSINTVLPTLENELFKNLLIEKKINRFSTVFLKFIENLSLLNEGGFSKEFFIKFYDVLKNLNIQTSGSSDFLQFYKIILINCDGEEIPQIFVSKILRDLEISIKSENTYINVIMESFAVSVILFQKFRNKTDTQQHQKQISELQKAITEKSHNKQYSSELRQSSIKSLSELIYNIKLSDDIRDLLLKIIEESLNYEATVKTSISSIIKVFGQHSLNSSEDINLKCSIINKLVQFMNSPDDSLYFISLRALSEVTTSLLSNSPFPNNAFDFQTVVPSLLVFSREAEMKQILIMFKIFTNILKFSSLSFLTEGDSFLDLVIQIIDTKFDKETTEYDLDDYESFVKELCNHVEPLNLFQKLYERLDLNLFISAITLSIIAIKGNLTGSIEKIESELLAGQNVLFNVQFLGVTSSTIVLSSVNLDTFIKIFDSGTSDSIRVAAAKACGLYAIRDVEKYYNYFFEEYRNVDYHKEMILIALKEILINYTYDESRDGTHSEYSQQKSNMYSKIWYCVWDQQKDSKVEGEKEDINIAEAKFIADISSNICKSSPFYINKLISKSGDDETLMTKYTLIVVLKQLLSSNYKDEGHLLVTETELEIENFDGLLIEYLIKCLNFFDILNISIKQTLIGTLLTGLHNKPLVFYPLLQNQILPFVFNELEAKAEFKKTIPMGPYKYNIDEGLEIRKLSYEFLYTILSIDSDLNLEYGVAYFQIINEILEKGFKDNENDIIVLSAINLSTFIAKTPNILNENEIFDKLTEQIKLVLSKKLRAKASRQETESFEECQKTIFKLCSTINGIVTNSSESKSSNKFFIRGNQLSSWNATFTDIKGNFEF